MQAWTAVADLTCCGSALRADFLFLTMLEAADDGAAFVSEEWIAFDAAEAWIAFKADGAWVALCY